MKLHDYLREPIRDNEGIYLPISRLDLGLSIPITVAAMAATVFLFEPFNVSNLVKSVASVVICGTLVGLSTFKRSVLGVAAGIIAVRCVIGSVISYHWTMALASIGFAVVAFMLLRGVESPR